MSRERIPTAPTKKRAQKKRELPSAHADKVAKKRCGLGFGTGSRSINVLVGMSFGVPVGIDTRLDALNAS